MISYQTREPGAPLERIESETPSPEGSQVLLRMLACGVCHSDIHLHDGVFDLGNDKELEVGRPGLVLGHEIFGEIVAVGSGVSDVVPGDRRVVYPWIGCGDCPSCMRGDEHLCTPGRGLGTVAQGGFADHVLVPHSRYLFDKGQAPDALASTYACSGLTAYSALKKIGKRMKDDEVLIIGAGGVGMMAIQIAMSVFGIDPIVVDIDDNKLEAARELGVTRVFNSSDRTQAKEIRELSVGGVFAALDFVGAEASVNFGLSCLRKGGRLVIIGLYGGALNVPLPFIPMNARIIQGSYVGTLKEMEELMELVRQGRIEPIKIEERPLNQASQALGELKQGRVQGRIVLTNQDELN